VILSGAAPSRQWRKPVQLMDVVRAAVAEVEDYERIEVRRLPRIAVTGPAVADLTHLVAELLENATVFSPPHTAVQVLGERVANGFTLEIHDRGLGMAADALLDANLRLAETPEFELSDTDRLGLFVVSRLAQRQNVRVSLQPSPYGGTTAVVFVPDALLTDDVPDTNGIGFRLDRPHPSKEAELGESRRTSLSKTPVQLPGLPAALLDGPVELEAPVDLDAVEDFSGALGDEDSERGGIFRPRRSIALADDEAAGHGDGPLHGHPDTREAARFDAGDGLGEAVPLTRRRPPKLISSHGRPVTEQRSRRESVGEEPPAGPSRTEPEAAAPLPQRRRGDAPQAGTSRSEPDAPPLPTRRRGASPLRPGTGGPDRSAEPGSRAPERRGGSEGPQPPALPGRSRPAAIAPRGEDPAARRPGTAQDTGPGNGPLPRRVRQANLAPQLKQSTQRPAQDGAQPVERDADEVRSRMASLQRGWQRGRNENAAGDDAHSGTAPQGTTEGDGR